MAERDGIKLFFAGDLMTGRGIDQLLPHPNDPQLHEPYVRDARQYIILAERHSGRIPAPVGLDYVWGDSLPLLKQQCPDASLVNLETALTSSDDWWLDKGIHYRMHPDNAASLLALKLDCCALANNHLLDWGYAGLEETLRVLDSLNIAASGAGLDRRQAAAPAVLPISDAQRVLVFSVGLPSSGIPPDWAAADQKSGVNLLPDLSDDSLLRLVDQMRCHRKPGDLVVVSIHWGGNWGYQILESQRRFARALVDAGADLVHGHSSHHPIGMELYRGRLICYGCGDFVNDYEGIRGYEAFRAHLSLMYFLNLEADGAMRRLDIAPMQTKKLRLCHAEEADLKWIAAVLQRESHDYGLQLALKQAGSTTLLEALPSTMTRARS
ncbi:CapA family protein [Proteobacteria bacterium 005FR1]|nr:CapA family protein [Proteobacteria bacterium 005FR1]